MLVLLNYASNYASTIYQSLPCSLEHYWSFSKLSSHSRKYKIKFNSELLVLKLWLTRCAIDESSTGASSLKHLKMKMHRCCYHRKSSLVQPSCDTGSLLDPSLSTTLAALVWSLTLLRQGRPHTAPAYITIIQDWENKGFIDGIRCRWC